MNRTPKPRLKPKQRVKHAIAWCEQNLRLPGAHADEPFEMPNDLRKDFEAIYSNPDDGRTPEERRLMLYALFMLHLFGPERVV
jgi:hypothetical protein